MKRLIVACVTAGLLAGLLLGQPAFAGEEASRKPAYDFWRHNYFCSRGKDLLDVISIRPAYSSYDSFVVHARLMHGVEAGFTHFNGWKIGNEKCGFGVLAEQKSGGGVFSYPTWMKQNVFWQTAEAKERSLFVADLGVVPSLKKQKAILYDAQNRNWASGALELQLPLLPGAEVAVDYGEAVDFILSWIPFVPGLRVPKAHSTTFDDQGRIIPKVNTYHWHGANQAEFEKY